MNLVGLLLGMVLLLFGRSLYWAFVAVVGFLVGMELAAELLPEQTEVVRLLTALAGGVLGALIGIFLQRIAFAAGGLFAGGYLGLALARAAGLPGEPLVWFLLGGVLGAIVAALILDWAIIGLSSLAGATVVVSQFDLMPPLAALLFIVLCVAGIVLQGRRLRAATVPERPTL